MSEERVTVRADDVMLVTGLLRADIAAGFRSADPRITEPLDRLTAALVAAGYLIEGNVQRADH